MINNEYCNYNHRFPALTSGQENLQQALAEQCVSHQRNEHKFSNLRHHTTTYISHLCPSTIRGKVYLCNTLSHFVHWKNQFCWHSQSLKFKVLPLFEQSFSPIYLNLQSEDMKAEQFQQLWQILAFVKNNFQELFRQTSRFLTRSKLKLPECLRGADTTAASYIASIFKQTPCQLSV